MNDKSKKNLFHSFQISILKQRKYSSKWLLVPYLHMFLPKNNSSTFKAEKFDMNLKLVETVFPPSFIPISCKQEGQLAD